MSAQTRKLEVRYGNIVVGGSSTEYLLDGFTSTQQEFEKITFNYVVVVASTSAGGFASSIKKLEDEFRRLDSDFEVKSNGVTIHSYKQSENTGFDGKPVVTRGPNILNTGYTRRYNISITFGLPAIYDRAQTVGLRYKTVAVDYTASNRMKVSISGEFTAVKDSNAKTIYTNAVTTLCEDTLTFIDAALTFEKISESLDYTTNYKTVSFSRVYQEILFEQGSQLDVDYLVDHSILIDRAIKSTPQSPGFNDQETLLIRYSASIDKTLKTGSQLKGIWDDTLRDYVLSTARDFNKNTASLAVIEESPTFDVTENTISCSMTIQTQGSGNLNAVSYLVQTADTINHGVVPIPAYTGKPLDRYIFNSFKTIRRVITQTIRVIGDKKPPLPENADAAPAGFKDGKWYTIDTAETTSPLQVGVDGNRIDMTDFTITTVKEYMKAINQAAPDTGSTTANSDVTPSSGSTPPK